jgi:predicted nucleic-acid-binding Zn-ribbon protein
MPGIFRVSCSHCDFTTSRAIAAETSVQMADGTEEVCPHPLERRIAEERTGLPWKRLTAEGRIRYRYAAVCASCGAVDYYEPEEPGRRGLARSIVAQPSHRDFAQTPCVHCGASRLYGIADRDIGTVDCPICGHGRLSTKLTAVS